MANMKSETFAQMQAYISAYTERAEQANDKMLSALANIKNAKEEALEAFAQAAENILENFESIELENKEMESSLMPLKEISEELNEKMSSFMDDIRGPADEISLEQDEVSEEKEPEAPDLRIFKPIFYSYSRRFR